MTRFENMLEHDRKFNAQQQSSFFRAMEPGVAKPGDMGTDKGASSMARHGDKRSLNNPNATKQSKTKKDQTPKKVTKRKKGAKEQFKNFSILYSNIRGIKSKIETLNEIIEQKKPTVICITETHLKEGDKVEFEGYSKPYRNDRNGNKSKGGVLIAEKQKLENITIEVDRVNDVEESIWVLVNNAKTKLRIGVIYAPQEGTKKEELIKMYDRIENSINVGKQRDENVIITGDFNAKIKITKEKNTQERTAAGKMLEDLEKRNKLYIVNRDKKIKGFYTRAD